MFSIKDNFSINEIYVLHEELRALMRKIESSITYTPKVNQEIERIREKGYGRFTPSKRQKYSYLGLNREKSFLSLTDKQCEQVKEYKSHIVLKLREYRKSDRDTKTIDTRLYYQKLMLYEKIQYCNHIDPFISDKQMIVALRKVVSTTKENLQYVEDGVTRRDVRKNK